MRTYLCNFSFYVGFKKFIVQGVKSIIQLHLQFSGFHGNVSYKFNRIYCFALRSVSLVSFPQNLCLNEDVSPAQPVLYPSEP